MPRFVILRHDHPMLHWDLMLEEGDVLATWRLPARPEGACTMRAVKLGNHRLHYLDYEGPVSGGRGHVVRWDRGEYQRADTGRLRLLGEKWQGEVTIREAGGEWTIIFDPRETLT